MALLIFESFSYLRVDEIGDLGGFGARTLLVGRNQDVRYFVHHGELIRREEFMFLGESNASRKHGARSEFQDFAALQIFSH